jgi:hypothetical protein
MIISKTDTSNISVYSYQPSGPMIVTLKDAPGKFVILINSKGHGTVINNIGWEGTYPIGSFFNINMEGSHNWIPWNREITLRYE